MLRRITIALSVLVLSAGCAQIPPQSVELSATVGRDMAEIEKSHLLLVDALFDKYEAEASKFIDQVYAPYYIRKSLQRRLNELVEALQAAAKSGSTADDAQLALGMLQIFLETAHKEIESYRESKLAPLRAQRKELRDRLTAAYARVHQANAATTGFIASVAKVTDLQNDLLARLGLPNLQSDIGRVGNRLSGELSELLVTTQGAKGNVDAAVGKFEKLMDSWKQR